MKIKQLLTVLIIITVSLSLFSEVAISAAESMTNKWVLVETKINPDNVPLISATKSSSFDNLDEFTVTETSIYKHSYYQQFAYEGYPNLVNEFTIQFVFDKPPFELVPGSTLTLNVQGQMNLVRREQTGGYIGSDIRYVYGKEFFLQSIEGNGNIQQIELPNNSNYGASRSQIILTVNEDKPTGFFTATFVLDEVLMENPDADEIYITLDSSGYKIIWIYQNEGTQANEVPETDDSFPVTQETPKIYNPSPLSQEEQPDNKFQEDRQGTDSGINPIIYVGIGAVLISIILFCFYNLRRDRY